MWFLVPNTPARPPLPPHPCIHVLVESESMTVPRRQQETQLLPAEQGVVQGERERKRNYMVWSEASFPRRGARIVQVERQRSVEWKWPPSDREDVPEH